MKKALYLISLSLLAISCEKNKFVVDEDPEITSWEEALRTLNLSPQEKQDLIAFLHALTDNSIATDPKFSATVLGIISCK